MSCINNACINACTYTDSSTFICIYIYIPFQQTPSQLFSFYWPYIDMSSKLSPCQHSQQIACTQVLSKTVNVLHSFQSIRWLMAEIFLGWTWWLMRVWVFWMSSDSSPAYFYWTNINNKYKTRTQLGTYKTNVRTHYRHAHIYIYTFSSLSKYFAGL